MSGFRDLRDVKWRCRKIVVGAHVHTGMPRTTLAWGSSRMGCSLSPCSLWNKEHDEGLRYRCRRHILR